MVRTPRTHSRSGKSPVTIDLEAEPAAPAGEAAPERPAAPEGDTVPPGAEDAAPADVQDVPAAEAPEPVASRRSGGLVVAALAGGLIGIAGAAALDRYMAPAPDSSGAEELRSEIAAIRSELSQRIDAAGSERAAADERLSAVEGAIEEMRNALAEVQAGGTVSEAGGTELAAFEERLTEIERRLATLAEGAPAADPGLADRLGGLDAALVALREEAGNARAAIERQQAAAGDLDRRLSELAERLDSGPAPEVALAIAAAALKSAVERGASFGTELDTWARLAPEAEGIEELRSMAAAGVPTRARIEAELPAAITAMVGQVTAASPDDGVFSRLFASLQSLIRVRPIGQIEGNTPFARLARIEIAIRDNDYDKALAEYAELPEDVRAAGADYFARVEARARADRLVEAALAGALRAGG